LSVRKTEVALTLLEDLLAIELLLARDVLATMPDRPAMGAGTSHALRLVEQAPAATDPTPADIHQALRARLPDLETDRH
jgi:histidine ammonia-lyase